MFTSRGQLKQYTKIKTIIRETFKFSSNMKIPVQHFVIYFIENGKIIVNSTFVIILDILKLLPSFSVKTPNSAGERTTVYLARLQEKIHRNLLPATVRENCKDAFWMEQDAGSILAIHVYISLGR